MLNIRSFIIAAIIFSLLSACSSTTKEAVVPEKTGCLSGDCANGAGTFVYPDGNTYTGSWKNSKREGRGELVYSDGTKQTGTWSNNSMNGDGIMEFSSGDVYKGTFKNSAFLSGKYTYADGTVEEGDFIEYVFAGTIKLPVTVDKDKVEVGRVLRVNEETKEVEISGTSYRAGDKLYVEVESVMAALKVVTIGNGSTTCVMIGQTAKYITKVSKGMPLYKLMGGVKKGSNEFLFPNGNRYVGEYKGDLMDGKGTFYWTNGTVYAGEFKKGRRHGKGVIHNFDRTVYDGDWKNGRYDGYGRYEWPTGTLYEGGYKNGTRTGKGNMSWSSGATYSGEWLDDYYHGQGIMHYDDGTWYEGGFAYGWYHGEGAIHEKDGSIKQKGKWNYGKFLGGK